jgi:hypothetical protein
LVRQPRVGFITPERCKRLLVELARVPSRQTALMEPLLRAFTETTVEQRLRPMGFVDIRYFPMGNRSRPPVWAVGLVEQECRWL